MTWAHARQVPGTAASKGVRIRGYRFRRGCVEGFPGTDPTPGLRADIFRPQGRMGPNEPCHQLLAPRVLKHFHRYPTAAKQVFLAAKRSIFANHHTRNAVKENRTAAHRTWRERGVNGAVAIDAARLTTGIFERVHLAVQHDTALLHPPIVATAENLPVVNEHRADGDTSLGQPALCFLDRGSQEFLHRALLSGGDVGRLTAWRRPSVVERERARRAGR